MKDDRKVTTADAWAATKVIFLNTGRALGAECWKFLKFIGMGCVVLTVPIWILPVIVGAFVTQTYRDLKEETLKQRDIRSPFVLPKGERKKPPEEG